jgi:hypothetical protein
VRVRGDEAEISIPSSNGYRRYRALTPNEVQDLKTLTSRPEIEDLGPESFSSDSEDGDYDGPSCEYLRLSQETGRRILLNLMRRAPKKEATLHEELAGLFYTLSRTGDFKIRYDLEDKIPGLEVLLTSDKQKILAVAQEGKEVRVLVEELRTRERRGKDEFPYHWRSFDAGQLGGKASAPTALADYFDTAKSLLPIEFLTSASVAATPQILPKQRVIYSAMPFGKEMGIWKIPAGGEPVKIREGNYMKVVVTADETWAVAAKMPQEGFAPAAVKLVRMNLQTGEEFSVATPEGMLLWPLAFAPALQQVLLSNAQPFGYATGDKHFLLNPATGKIQAIKGEFRPLTMNTSMLFQPTGKANEVWASIYDSEKRDCLIGRYDLATFTFTSALKLPGLGEPRTEMWVDEATGKVYFVHDGNLLRVALPKS